MQRFWPRSTGFRKSQDRVAVTFAWSAQCLQPVNLTPASLHARTPLIFGSKDKVERVARYYADGNDTRIAPLFARRGLLRH